MEKGGGRRRRRGGPGCPGCRAGSRRRPYPSLGEELGVLFRVIVICPGLHRQHDCTSLNGGEYPEAADLKGGYVFRVENQGTAFFLQRLGRTGQLTPLKVTKLASADDSKKHSTLGELFSFRCAHFNILSVVAYGLCVLLTLAIMILMGLSEDWWGVFVVGLLILCRAVISLFVARRNELGWRGAREPGRDGDLIVLLSQDRWVRLRGSVDDLKAVTSGQWLRDLTRFEGFVVGLATILVYLDAALASNLKMLSKILLIVLLVGTAGLLEVATAATDKMIMHGRIIEQDGDRRPYDRRLQLAQELVNETKRHDWALKLGMITDDDLKKMDLEAPAGQHGALAGGPHDQRREVGTSGKSEVVQEERVTGSDAVSANGRRSYDGAS